MTKPSSRVIGNYQTLASKTPMSWNFMRASFMSLCSVTPLLITLLKIKLYLHLSALSKALVLTEKVPPEVLNAIRDQMLSGTALACRNITMNRSTQASIIRELQSQIKSFYKEVNTLNHRFWSALLKPDFTPFGERRCAFMRYDSVEKMQVVLRYNYDACVEVPGAIDVARKLREIYLTNDIMEAATEELYSR